MGLFSRNVQASRSGIAAILIVEDEPLVAFENEHALAQAGYHVVATVDRYDAAVEALRAGPVDLVIADIRLKGKRGGIDVARQAGSLDIPVLFSTARCPPDAEPLGVGWIAKPYLPRDLVRAIRVVDRLLDGGMPRAVPPAMTLFGR